MDKTKLAMGLLYTDRFTETRWKVMQWCALSVGVGFLLYMMHLWNVGGLNLANFISYSYCAIAATIVGYTIWYSRWYWSDAAVEKIASQALAIDDKDLADAVVNCHPRRVHIRAEMERQASQ